MVLEAGLLFVNHLWLPAGLVLCRLLWVPPWRKSCVIKPSCPGPRHPLDRWSKKVKFEVYDFFFDFLFENVKSFEGQAIHFYPGISHPLYRWSKKVKPQIVTFLRSSNEKMRCLCPRHLRAVEVRTWNEEGPNNQYLKWFLTLWSIKYLSNKIVYAMYSIKT